MAEDHQNPQRSLEEVLATWTPDELAARLSPKHGPLPPRPTRHPEGKTAPEAIAARWQELMLPDTAHDALADSWSLAAAPAYGRNIENFIGTAKIPVGLAGPLQVNGIFAQDAYYVPLATTEAALVASYNRGARLIGCAGGATATVLSEGLTRVPGFAFADLIEVSGFSRWVQLQVGKFREIVKATTRFGKLIDMSIHVEGNHVYLAFFYTTGDAAGQNMVTFATEEICRYIAQHSPVRPGRFLLEANMSGDKKASFQSFMTVRGKKATAEVRLSGDHVREHLHTSADEMAEAWRISTLGNVMSGTIGVQAQFANALTALFIATGQDVACVAESAVGVTRFETTSDGGLYAAVTLPNLIVGTVGGGTGLPTQKACLDIMGLAGFGKARAYAEVCAALCLAGELSLAGAMCANEFSRAHRTLARGPMDEKT